MRRGDAFLVVFNSFNGLDLEGLFECPIYTIVQWLRLVIFFASNVYLRMFLVSTRQLERDLEG
jgi:hypothetical protein